MISAFGVVHEYGVIEKSASQKALRAGALARAEHQNLWGTQTRATKYAMARNEVRRTGRDARISGEEPSDNFSRQKRSAAHWGAGPAKAPSAARATFKPKAEPASSASVTPKNGLTTRHKIAVAGAGVAGAGAVGGGVYAGTRKGKR